LGIIGPTDLKGLGKHPTRQGYRQPDDPSLPFQEVTTHTSSFWSIPFENYAAPFRCVCKCRRLLSLYQKNLKVPANL